MALAAKRLAPRASLAVLILAAQLAVRDELNRSSASLLCFVPYARSAQDPER
jgi:hypothetical protein